MYCVLWLSDAAGTYLLLMTKKSGLNTEYG